MGMRIEMGYDLNPYQIIQSQNTTEMGWLLNGSNQPTFYFISGWAMDAAKNGSEKICWQILDYVRTHDVKMGTYKDKHSFCPSNEADLITLRSWRRRANDVIHLFSKHPTSYDICVLQGNCAMKAIIGEKEDLALKLIKGAILNPMRLVQNLPKKDWLEQHPLLLEALQAKVKNEQLKTWFELWPPTCSYRIFQEQADLEKELPIPVKKKNSNRL